MLVKRTNLKVFTSKFVGTGPSFYKKRIFRAVVSQRLRNTGLECNSFLVGLGGWGGVWGAMSDKFVSNALDDNGDGLDV